MCKSDGATDLDEVGHVAWHFRNGRVVEVLDVLQRTLVSLRHEVYGDSLTTKPAASSDPEIR